MPARNKIVIGDITIKADATDEESGIKNVTFSIDEKNY
ncbi:MAG: Ig-like domain-containing protein [Candidatus Thermoplasmatota archaeon]